MSAFRRIGGEGGAEEGEDSWHFLCRRRPKNIQIDPEIGVRQPMSHIDRLNSGDGRKSTTRLARNLGSRFAEYLDSARQGVGELFIRIQIRARPATGERLRRLCHLDHMRYSD